MGEVLKYDDAGNLLSVNLDLKNPSAGDPFEHVPPEELVAGIVEKEQQILALMIEIQEALEPGVEG
ncbi:MAG: hypothetical protein GY847_11090 [Proteobacteria bacterium]|nr:hypothetical protein [Pseudomonadota bacterium]